jgi:hypothetical protein
MIPQCLIFGEMLLMSNGLPSMSMSYGLVYFDSPFGPDAFQIRLVYVLLSVKEIICQAREFTQQNVTAFHGVGDLTQNTCWLLH